MIVWKLEYHPKTKDDFRQNVALKDRQFIYDTIQKRLSAEPEKAGKSLGRELSGFRRLRISKYRIIYQIQKSKIVVCILMVDRRETVYEEIFKRVGL